jgi:uncharacterized protein YdeI (YjbR/CyaY-like superfamily)
MVNKAMRNGAGVAAGETVKLALAPDKSEPTVAMPAELEAALAHNTAAAAAFAGLACSHRKEYADWIAGAKKQETRTGRAQKAALMLIEGKPGR